MRVKAITSLALSALLLVQGLMPAGYMPASVDDGWAIMLCPEGLPAGFLEGRDDHHHHHGHAEAAHGDAHADTDYCPIGSALDTATVAPLLSAPVLLDAAAPAFAALMPARATLKARRAFPARGPPLS